MISEQFVELRPRDAAAFVATMQREIDGSLAAAGSAGPLSVPVDPAAGVPTECPHCGGRLLWGEGPHAGDARVRAETAFAWECESCRSAGLLMLT